MTFDGMILSTSRYFAHFIHLPQYTKILRLEKSGVNKETGNVLSCEHSIL